MSFLEAPTFPDLLAYGALGGPMFATSVVTTQGGAEYRNRARLAPRHVYELGLVNRTVEETEALLAFFRTVAMGRRHGFRFRDFGPGQASGSQEPLGTGTGLEATYQLVKCYTSGTLTYNRPITKPVPGSLLVAVNGVPATSFEVDTSTGEITLSAALGTVLTASFAFDVPVRFDIDQIEVRRVAPRLYSWESVRLIEVRDTTASGSYVEAGGSLGSPDYLMLWEFTLGVAL